MNAKIVKRATTADAFKLAASRDPRQPAGSNITWKA